MNITISGAEALIRDQSILFGGSTLPFLLDDVGCNGSENNILDCLPQHNCDLSYFENAGVQCLREGK